MASSVGETQIVAVPGFGGPAPSPGRWWPMDGAHGAWLCVLADLPPRAASDGDSSIVFFTGTGIVSATVASFAFAAAAEQREKGTNSETGPENIITNIEQEPELGPNNTEKWTIISQRTVARFLEEAKAQTAKNITYHAKIFRGFFIKENEKQMVGACVKGKEGELPRPNLYEHHKEKR
uniref:Uncharacterized protein n=1 Tax=Oryza glumipatula TaxID=40148 RepID=A0A0D9YE54_9ORYZ